MEAKQQHRHDEVDQPEETGDPVKKCSIKFISRADIIHLKCDHMCGVQHQTPDYKSWIRCKTRSSWLY
uniref:Uncharacterized protein n=1 Tax=Arion vulgaris TaxID=1028688 RepID=A0A0B7AP25_9EUPU